MEAIQIRNLSKSFGDHVIFDDFQLDIKKNTITALMGSSGCGKTTLLNILGLIEPFDSGRVHILGQKAPKVNSKKATLLIRQHISYLFQNFALIETMSVEQNLRLALRYVKGSKRQKKQKILEALKQVGMEEYLRAKVFTLSGGQQQRIALARALLKPSEILLADEPTGSLDAENRQVVMELLVKVKEQGKTIVLVSHDPNIEPYCDQVIHL